MMEIEKKTRELYTLKLLRTLKGGIKVSSPILFDLISFCSPLLRLVGKRSNAGLCSHRWHTSTIEQKPDRWERVSSCLERLCSVLTPCADQLLAAWGSISALQFVRSRGRFDISSGGHSGYMQRGLRGRKSVSPAENAVSASHNFRCISVLVVMHVVRIVGAPGMPWHALAMAPLGGGVAKSESGTHCPTRESALYLKP